MRYPKLISNAIIKERNELFLFINPEKPNWFFGREDALKVVKKCNGKNSILDIIKLLSEETKEPKERLQSQIPEFVQKIKKIGFVEGGEKKSEVKIYYPFHILSAWLHITHECNLRCKYCHLSAGKPLKNELTTKEIFGVIDEIKALGDGKQEQNIAITGGEPLIRDDVWEIAEYAKEQDMVLKLSTNGTLINQKVAKEIKKYFNIASISLDGLREAHDNLRGEGTFDLVIQGIEKLCKVGVDVEIGSTITKENLNDIPKLLELAEKYHVKNFAMSPLVPTGRAVDRTLMPSSGDYVTLVKEIKEKKRKLKTEISIAIEKFLSGKLIPIRREYPCAVGITTLSVDSDGSIYPCAALHKEAFKAGNIRERPLKEIWKNSEVFRVWREITVDTIPKCSACVWKRFCGGACRANAYYEYGTIRAPDIYCDAYSMLFEEALWEYGEKEIQKVTHR